MQNSSFLTNIQILTSVGSSAETPERHGLAHILEHMFFKGSKKRPGGTIISRAANDIGGKMNAYTTYDHTVYYITVLNDKFETGLDILSDMYLHPIFAPEEFDRELNPILSEYREREDDPDNFLIERALEKYMGSNYHPVIGTEETITRATVEDMHDFKNRYYGGENCMLSIVGGLSEERAVKAIESLFSPDRETQTPVDIEIEYLPGNLNLKKPGIQEAYYYKFYPALPPMHPERYKQDMMNYILGGNDSALLFERIREELGMSCYGVYSWIMRYDSFSILCVACGIAQEEVDQLDKEIDDQIKRLCDSPVSDEMLNRARASLRTSIAAKSETSSGLGSMISVPVLKGAKENPVNKALAEIAKINAEDILEMARKTFAIEPFRAVLWPE